MKEKNVVNEYGEFVTIDEGSKKLYDFNNKQKKITYNARIIENGEPTRFYTNYTVDGTIDNIEDRLTTWNNVIKMTYAECVGYYASKNDPDKKIWDAFVKYAYDNQDKLFDEYGDFTSRFDIVSAVKKIKNI